MLRLLNQRLDALAVPLDPGFGFDLIRLEACLAEKTHAAEASFDTERECTLQVNFLLDRLSARFGEQRVQRFCGSGHPYSRSPKRGSAGPGTRFPWRLDAQAPCQRSAPQTPAPSGKAGRNQGELCYSARRIAKIFHWRQCKYDVARTEGPERIVLEWWKENPHDRLIPSREQKKRVKLGPCAKAKFAKSGLFPGRNAPGPAILDLSRQPVPTE